MSLPYWFSSIVDVLDKPMEFSWLAPKDLSKARQSAVLLLFSDHDNQPHLTFIKRAAGLTHHPNQIAFPGGVIEQSDKDAITTALREAQEEIGLNPSTVLPIGKLPQISIEVTGFAVTPVISYWYQPHSLSVLQPAEVEEVFTVPIEMFQQPKNQVWAVKQNYKGPGFLIDEKIIWGFTGTLLAQLLGSAGLISEFVGGAEIVVD